MDNVPYAGLKKRYRLHPMKVLNHLILIMLLLITFYPFWFVLVIALSEANRASGYELIFWPKNFTLYNVVYMLTAPDFFKIYENTAFVVVMGTFCSMLATLLLAFGLNQRVFGIRVVRVLVLFTMLFSGGMIPTYLIVRNTGLINNLWALIIPSLVSPFYTFLLLNAIKAIPDSLSESAQIDGAGPFIVLFRILLPLLMPTLATLTLFYAVDYWNTYFNAIIYTPKRIVWTLQIYMRQILLLNDTSGAGGGADSEIAQLGVNLKMATVLVSIVPIMMIYPFLQKYFSKGVMVGAVKQ